ncbi:MAG: oligopeptide ABC transporter permease [Erysipelotrichaceae bacterium]
METYTKEQFDRVGLQDSKQQEMLLGSTTPFLKDAWRRFTKNKGALVGLIAIIIIFVFAVFGPYINQFAYNVLDKIHVNLPPRIQFLEKLGIFNGSEGSYNPYIEKGFTNSYYWFGTDVLGRDLWDRVWMGTRISFYIAMVAVMIDMVIGIGYGMVSGFFGGKIDTVMQRIVEILSGIPNLVVVTLFVLVLKPGIVSIILALMITGWISMSRVVRAQVIKMKEHEFVLAAKTLGASSFILLFKELLPNIIGQIIVMTMFSIPNAIFYESFLAFVGLGLQPPLASLGVLIADGYRSMITHPHLVIFPVVVLSTLMLSFNLIADGLRDAFDPKMKGF